MINVLDKFIISKDMKKYLGQQNFQGYQIVNIIFYSPASIYEKLEVFKQMLCCEECSGDIKKSVEKCIEKIDFVIALWENASYIELEQVELSESNYVSFFHSRSEVENFIKNNPLQESQYYEATVSNAGYSYYIWGDSVRYFSSDDGCQPTEDVNLPVPFNVGDVLLIDGRPFNKRTYVLVLEVGDNVDCCSLQGLYKKNDYWHIGAIKHSDIGWEYPYIFPLYSAERVAEAKDNSRIFEYVQDFIQHDEQKGSLLWNKLTFAEKVTDEELLGILDKLKMMQK